MLLVVFLLSPGRIIPIQKYIVLVHVNKYTDIFPIFTTMKKLLLIVLVFMFGKLITAQTIYIQETDMYGNPYIVSYPINVVEPSFIRNYDLNGYHMYYNDSETKYSQEHHQTVPVGGFDPMSIDMRDVKAIMDLNDPFKK